MIDAQTLSIIFAGLSIAASIVYYASVLRNANKTQQMQLVTRQTQLFMQFLQVLNSKDNQRVFAELMNLELGDYDDFLQKYDHSVNEEHYGKRSSLWWNYNSIGYLMMDNLIPLDLAYKLVGTPIILMWEKWKDIIFQVRENQNLPVYFEGFEYAYQRLLEYQTQREASKHT